MKQLITSIALCSSLLTFAQVGVGTVSPVADLEVVANPAPAVGTYNGIVIPRVSTLPTGAQLPGANQKGLIIYLESGTATEGFYYFNGSAYVKVDDSTNNEGSLTVSDGTNTADIISNTSGSTNVRINGSTSINVEGTPGNITISNTFTHTIVNAGIGTGNGSAGPLQIDSGTYINVNPGGGNPFNNYVIPDPALVPGRQYIIRNINNSNAAFLVSLNSTGSSKLIFSGNSSVGAQFYELQANGPTKTVTLISDGVNWTALIN